MEIRRIRALRGPNLWSRRTALEAIVALADGERSIRDIPGFEHRLHARFPALGDLRTGWPNGVSYPLHQAPHYRVGPAAKNGHNGKSSHSHVPIGLAHALGRSAFTLQQNAGCPVSFWRCVPTIEHGVYQVVVEYREEEVGRKAFEAAASLCEAALRGGSFDIAVALRQIQAMDEEIRLGPSTGSIVRAALDRGVPIRRLNEHSLVQFGWGSHQRRILAAETDRTSAIAESIAQDKQLTKTLLEAAGVPVPEGRSVSDAADAWAAACEIGLPVVVKPRHGSQGRGVAVNLRSRERVEAAYTAAAAVTEAVVVERFAPGKDFRLLVVGGHLVAAARRDPPQVVGDGKRTVRQLVDLVNQDPRRREGHATSLSRIPIDPIALGVLAEQCMTPDSVPPKGVTVLLRGNANLSTGGSATDVTEEVHPDVAACAVEAARIVGLDICGVDVVAEGVSRPLEDQAGVIVEVNAAPGFRMHLDPSYGKGRPVGKAVVDAMFPEGDDGRIPVVAVSGTNGKTTVVRLIAHLLRGNGKRVGLTCSDGIYVEGRRLDAGDCSGPRSARAVLMHPMVDAAVFETARGGILREGLGFDRCDVAVVTNVGTGDHLGLAYITTVEDLAVIKRVIVENVTQAGVAVLNAGDPLVAPIADACPGTVTFFASDPKNAVLVDHRAKGGRVVFRDDATIVAAQEGFEWRMDVKEVPLTRGGVVPFEVENAMAAICAAWGMGVPWDVIRAGLKTFVSDVKTAPGRFNVLSYKGATVIADYGHNPDAIQALADAIQRMQARRRVVLISAAGDRRDADIRRQTEILGEVFDDVILYQDACQRGREDGEVLALLREGLAKTHRAKLIAEIRGEFDAISATLERLEPGDLALVLIDQVEDALEFLQKRIAEVATIN